MVLLTLTSQGFTRVQNQLARLVTNSPPFTLSVSLLYSLHWLPRFRKLFKINFLTYKTLREKQPVYLHSMLASSIPFLSLRSNNENSLSVPRVKINTSARAFHSCAPSLWNIPRLSVHSASSVATFKKYLKTHLFDLAFPTYMSSLPTACWCYGSVSSILLLNMSWLSRHWAWLRLGYWQYRSLIDWLIDRPLVWFQTTFLLLLACEFWPSHKLSSTKRYNQSTSKPSGLITKIMN